MDMSTLGAALSIMKKNTPTINPEDIAEAVEDYLDDHPEATTTVQDGSITKAKLDNNLQGTVDDVSDLKSALHQKQNVPSATGTAGQVLGLGSNSNPVWMSEVIVSASQPQDSGNKLWIKDGEEINYIVPTYAEYEALVSALSDLGNEVDDKYEKPSTGIPASDLESGVVPDVSGFYTKPSTGIPASDLASGIVTSVVNVSGATPNITGAANTRYICGQVNSLVVTAPASGIIDIVFESGSTPTALTVSSAKSGVTAVKFPDAFDPSNLDANTTYEINILNGEFGLVSAWT